jgi:CRP/FNR family transcriptional regulator, cyclic AMP receptor protein
VLWWLIRVQKNFLKKGGIMFIKEADLFKELDEQTMIEISKIMVEESHQKGDVIYTEKSPANHFYILWEGRVRLSIGTEAEIDYTVNKRGEVFGWSSIVGRDSYTAKAECVSPCKVWKINKDKLNEVFKKYPHGGVIFFKRLAGAVVQRLVDNYDAFLSEGSLKGVTSQGTGQVAAPGED